MSNNLGFTAIPGNADNPEAGVNDIAGRLDSALTETLPLDASSGNVSVTLDQAQQAVFIEVIGAAVARDVLLPQCKRIFFVRNSGSAVVTFKRGSASVPVAAGATGILRLTGAADGLFPIASGSSGGGSGGGIEEAPENGNTYGRNNGEWVEVEGGTPNPASRSPTGESAPITVPKLADYSAPINGADVTFNDIPGVGITIATVLRKTGDLFPRITKAVTPTGNIRTTCGFRGTVYGPRFPAIGFELRNANSQKVTIELVIVEGVIKVESNLWNNDSTYNSSIASVPAYGFSSGLWGRLEWANNQIAAAISADGLQWRTLGSIGFATRPTHSALFVKPDAGPNNDPLYLKGLFYHHIIEQY